MKPRFKKVMAAVVIVALISTIGYGVYHYDTRSPNVTFTTVNFKVNYQGNFSNYLEPSVLNLSSSGNYRNNSYISLLKPNERISGVWQMMVPFTFGFNSSSTLYKNLYNNSFDLEDSVVINSVEVTTPGFRVSIFGNGFYQDNLVYVPTEEYAPYYSDMFVTVHTMYYHGPLNITINATSPAPNIVVFNTNFSIKYSGNQSAPYAETSVSTSGIYFGPKNYQAIVSPQGIAFSVWLASVDNFSITSITISAPFSIPQNAYSQPVRELNGGSYGYYDNLNFNITPPGGPFMGYLNITVYTN